MPEETEYAENNQTVSENFDPVNRPVHYNSHPSGVEVIELTEHLDFATGNSVKYLCRHGLKGSAVQDLEKAIWYIRREIYFRRLKELSFGEYSLTFGDLYWSRVEKYLSAEPDGPIKEALRLLLVEHDSITSLEAAITYIQDAIAEVKEISE